MNGGDLTEAKNYVRLIRQRAGIVAGAYDYGMSVATDKASMRDLILTERQVEFAMEGMRNFDLRRTRNLNKITPRLSYKLVCKPPYYPGVTRTGALGTDIFLEKVQRASSREIRLTIITLPYILKYLWCQW